MDSSSLLYLIVAVAVVFSLAAYVGLILMPAWRSYSSLWQRLAASFLSLYVFFAVAGVGLVFGFVLVWFTDGFS